MFDIKNIALWAVAVVQSIAIWLGKEVWSDTKAMKTALSEIKTQVATSNIKIETLKEQQTATAQQVREIERAIRN